MQFTIYRDLASIAFVRCVSPIPGSKFYAEGTSFSARRAIEKCRSEVIESSFQLAHPLREEMLGIAAHPVAPESADHARNEALETLLLLRLGTDPVFRGIAVTFVGVRLCLGRMNDRFAALALFIHDGVPTATQAIGRNPFKTALKAWTEVRNIRLYKPSASELSAYTKANRYLGAEQLGRISTKPLGNNFVDTKRLKQFQSHQQTHVITFFTQEAS
jgi:hypothetical protein